MQTITHFHRTFGRDGGAEVGLRYFSMVCEVGSTRGLRIPQVALKVAPPDAPADLESVDADPELLACADDWRTLLDHLMGRFGGQPIGELARRAAAELARAN